MNERPGGIGLLGAGRKTFEERNFVKGVYVFLEMLPLFGIAAIFVAQALTWCVVIEKLMKDEADRTDVLMLIPGFVFAGLIYVLVLQIPEAFKRKH